LAGVEPVTEVKMFGGIGFMLNGNLLVGASKRGLLLRVGKDRQSQALAKPGTRQMKMRDRAMDGYVYVDPPIEPSTVRGWVEMATAFVRTLAPKTKAKRRPTQQKRK
jgi:TfoX/Sxy family transcriptional regulator of competence genes